LTLVFPRISVSSVSLDEDQVGDLNARATCLVFGARREAGGHPGPVVVAAVRRCRRAGDVRKGEKAPCGGRRRLSLEEVNNIIII
jgi:hypothetical protein